MKETLEEAAISYAEESCNGQFPIEYAREQVVKHTKNDFIEGAKWQSERMYSEVFEWLSSKDYLSDKVDIIKKEFEQFKNKQL
jgi:hypothetical protein